VTPTRHCWRTRTDRTVTVHRIRSFCNHFIAASLTSTEPRLTLTYAFSIPTLLIQFTIPKSRSFVTVPNQAQGSMTLLTQNEIRKLILMASNHRTFFIYHLTQHSRTLHVTSSRSQWPRSLRRRSTAARLLRLWVRIPSGVCMVVVSVVCCQVEVPATR